MDNFVNMPISVEQFAAYLDGNLSEQEMLEVETLIASNRDLEELVSMSDILEEDIQYYLNDEFAFDTDMSALSESDFELPQIYDSQHGIIVPNEELISVNEGFETIVTDDNNSFEPLVVHDDIYTIEENSPLEPSCENDIIEMDPNIDLHNIDEFFS